MVDPGQLSERFLGGLVTQGAVALTWSGRIHRTGRPSAGSLGLGLPAPAISLETASVSVPLVWVQFQVPGADFCRVQVQGPHEAAGLAGAVLGVLPINAGSEIGECLGPAGVVARAWAVAFAAFGAFFGGHKLDFTHFKRHERGNLQYDGTEWRGVSVHRSWRSIVKNPPTPTTSGYAQR